MTVSARLGSRRRLSLLVVADDAGDPVEERADLDVHAGVLSGIDEFLKQRKSVSSCNQLTLGAVITSSVSAYERSPTTNNLPLWMVKSGFPISPAQSSPLSSHTQNSCCEMDMCLREKNCWQSNDERGACRREKSKSTRPRTSSR